MTLIQFPTDTHDLHTLNINSYKTNLKLFEIVHILLVVNHLHSTVVFIKQNCQRQIVDLKWTKFNLNKTNFTTLQLIYKKKKKVIYTSNKINDSYINAHKLPRLMYWRWKPIEGLGGATGRCRHWMPSGLSQER